MAMRTRRGWPAMTDNKPKARPTRPALPTLQADQRALLDPTPGDDVRHGLRDGFPTRRALLTWYQRAIVRTLGELVEDLSPADLVRDRTLVGALLTGPEREQYRADGMTVETATKYRRKLEQAVVLPACNRAYNALRATAGEYVDGADEFDFDDIVPDDQEHVAMRPAFQVADHQQHEALQQLWGGFEHGERLQSWLHDLNEPTNGALDDDLPATVGRDQTAQRHLLRGRADKDNARQYRERFAVTFLLPAFADGIERLDVGELATRSGGGLSASQG